MRDSVFFWGDDADDPKMALSPLIVYPFPLRRDCFVHLKLPADLTLAEVHRIEVMMKTLCQAREK